MKYIFFLLISFAPVFASAQMDCSKFENGRFIYPDDPNFLSVRKGAKQKSYTNGLLVAIWKVKWIDDCTFELTCKKLKNGQKNFNVGDVVRSKILSIDGNCFQLTIDAWREDVKILQGHLLIMCQEEADTPKD